MLKILLIIIVVFPIFTACTGDKKKSGRMPSSVSDNSPKAAVPPNHFGENISKKGVSTFDRVFTKLNSQGERHYHLPTPFPRLLERLRESLDLSPEENLFDNSRGLLAVHIPLGRSLQRNAAIMGQAKATSLSPYFLFPRVVIGVAGQPNQSEGKMGVLLRNRLYMGYVEKANVLEVISYNEEGGRYEYQLVHDYGEGLKPKVFQAERTVCLGCHQNQTPIFSRQPWAETNANKKISSLLIAEQKKRMKKNMGHEVHPCGKHPSRFCKKNNNYYYWGVPIITGIDTPSNIDNGTDEANYILPYNRLWREGCEMPQCRANILEIVLKEMLTERTRRFDPLYRKMVAVTRRVWSKKWSDGMWIPSPDLPNRNPFGEIGKYASTSITPTDFEKGSEHLLKIIDPSYIAEQFEPLRLREPLKVWDFTDTYRQSDIFEGFINGLKGHFTAEDIRRIDEQTFGMAQANGEALQVSNPNCKVTRIKESSETRLSLGCEKSEDHPLGFEVFLRMRLGESGQIISGGMSHLEGEMSETVDGKTTDFKVSIDDISPKGDFEKKDGVWVITIKLRTPLTGLRLRNSEGNALENIVLRVRPEEKTATAQLTAYRDFQYLQKAISALTPKTTSVVSSDIFMGHAPFRREATLTAILKELNYDVASLKAYNPHEKWPERVLEEGHSDHHNMGNGHGGGHHGDDHDDHGGEDDHHDGHDDHDEHDEHQGDHHDDHGPPPTAMSDGVDLFMYSCAHCHDNPGGFPPNFLYSTAHTEAEKKEERRQKLERCSKRIFYRLSMWNLTEEERENKKVPMPPANYIIGDMKISHAEWLKDFHPSLMEYIGQLVISSEDRSPNSISEILSRQKKRRSVAGIFGKGSIFGKKNKKKKPQQGGSTHSHNPGGSIESKLSRIVDASIHEYNDFPACVTLEAPAAPTSHSGGHHHHQ